MNIPEYSILDLRSVSQHDLTCAYRLMEDTKRERVDRYINEADRQRTITADHLARSMLSRRFSISPQEIIIGASERGQPVVKGIPCFISLSHSGNYVLCAVHDRPVGADIEELSTRGKRLLQKICTSEEREYILESGLFQPKRFFEVWTAKEAFLKHDGSGLAGGLSSVCVAGKEGLLSIVGECRMITGTHDCAVYSICFR